MTIVIINFSWSNFSPTAPHGAALGSDLPIPASEESPTTLG